MTISSVSAEIAPEFYAEMQEDAPEFLTIEVLDVRRGNALFRRNVPITITARVISIHRTQSGVRRDEIISIRYDHHRPRRGWVGPRPIAILSEGKRYPAFLRWDGDDVTYRPAARGASFEPPIAATRR